MVLAVRSDGGFHDFERYHSGFLSARFFQKTNKHLPPPVQLVYTPGASYPSDPSAHGRPDEGNEEEVDRTICIQECREFGVDWCAVYLEPLLIAVLVLEDLGTRDHLHVQQRSSARVRDILAQHRQQLWFRRARQQCTCVRWSVDPDPSGLRIQLCV